jgi:hypothetical protein
MAERTTTDGVQAITERTTTDSVQAITPFGRAQMLVHQQLATVLVHQRGQGEGSGASAPKQPSEQNAELQLRQHELHACEVPTPAARQVPTTWIRNQNPEHGGGVVFRWCPKKVAPKFEDICNNAPIYTVKVNACAEGGDGDDNGAAGGGYRQYQFPRVAR